MLNIYTKSDQAGYWLEQAKINDYVITQDEQYWLSGNNRVAIVELWDTREIGNLRFLSQHSNLLIIFIPEFTGDSIVRQFDLLNVVFFISGTLNYSLANAQIYFCPYFFSSTVDFYRAQPELLTQLQLADSSSFDILLGRRKPHRDIIYNTVDHKKHIVKYFPTHKDNDIKQYQKNEFAWPSILPMPTETVDMTAQAVTVNGTIVSLSQIVPTEIYNQTRYSVVAETCTDNSFSFFTEKVVKPILAKRMFVVAAGQYYLRNLQLLGFKTFSGIINEKYDNIADLTERTLAVCEQIELVTSLDQNLLRPVIKDILEHNYQHMMNFNWQESMIKNLSLTLQLINNSIGDIHV
jgi:hypothetical protein